MLSPRVDATATQGTTARIAPADIAAVLVSLRAVKRGKALSRRLEDASSRVALTTVQAAGWLIASKRQLSFSRSRFILPFIASVFINAIRLELGATQF
jgi:hypothetical protein